MATASATARTTAVIRYSGVLEKMV